MLTPSEEPDKTPPSIVKDISAFYYSQQRPNPTRTKERANTMFE
jgi:hypothetical protein